MCLSERISALSVGYDCMPTFSPWPTRASIEAAGVNRITSCLESTFPPVAVILSIKPSLRAQHCLSRVTKRAGSKLTFVRVEKSASHVNTFTSRSLIPDFLPASATSERPVRAYVNKSCRAATSGCFPQTPAFVHASPFAVCSH